MDSPSSRSPSSSYEQVGATSFDGQLPSEAKDHQVMTSEHGLSHWVTLPRPVKQRANPPAKIGIESGINLLVDSRHRLLIEDDAGHSLPPEQEWRVRQNYREEMLSLLHDVSSELNSPLQQILNVHLMTPAPESQPTPDSLFEPFAEPKPAEPAYEKKSWVDKVLPWRAKKINQCNKVLADEFLHQQKTWDQQRCQHEERYAKLWDNRLASVDNTEAFLRKLLSQIPCNTKQQTDISVDKELSRVWLNTHFPEVKMLPGLEYKVVEKELRLTCKSLTPTRKRQYYMQQVHAIGFRLIGEVFAAVPGLQEVVFSGFSQRLNPATAHLQQDFLYSVKVKRADWSGINFRSLSGLSLVEVMVGFELRRNMSKTGIFKAIEPFSKAQAQQSDIFTTQDMAGKMLSGEKQY